MFVRLLVSVLAILAAPCSSAWAHDPYTFWYVPGTNISCCNNMDCRVADDWRLATSGYEVYVEETWCPVPGNRVLTGIPSPPGDGHVCITTGMTSPCVRITCFLPGTQF